MLILHREVAPGGMFRYRVVVDGDTIYLSKPTYTYYAAMLIKDNKPLFKFEALNLLGVGKSHRPYHSHYADYVAVDKQLRPFLDLPAKVQFNRYTVQTQLTPISLIAPTYQDFVDKYVSIHCNSNKGANVPEESRVRKWLADQWADGKVKEEDVNAGP